MNDVFVTGCQWCQSSPCECNKSVASDCSGADDRQSDVERSGNPKRSGDNWLDSAIHEIREEMGQLKAALVYLEGIRKSRCRSSNLAEVTEGQ